MRKLISAEIYRCRRSLLFWLTLSASVLSGVFYGIVTVSGSFDGVLYFSRFYFSEYGKRVHR